MKNKSKTRLVKTSKALAAVAILVLAFFIGIHTGRDTVKPQTILVTETKVRYQTVEKPIVQYIDRSVFEYVESAKGLVELGNLNDLDELKQWLGNRMNVTTIHLQSPADEADCDDDAREMQSAALVDGHIVSFQIIGRSKYNALFKNKLQHGQSLHAINLAIIGNDIYYIEPQTGKIVFAMHLD